MQHAVTVCDCTLILVNVVPVLFIVVLLSIRFFFFFFNDTATTEIYTLSLHDALPISRWVDGRQHLQERLSTALEVANDPNGNSWGQLVLSDAADHVKEFDPRKLVQFHLDRKSTRLNSSHSSISYAVFCLKKKTKIKKT